MNAKYINLIWGLALVVAGGIFMAQNMGYLDEISPLFWIAFFTGLSLLFFASYFMTGVKNWGWLFPALGSAAIALTISLDQAGHHGSYVGAPIMAAGAIPFIVAYGMDIRKHWWALIPAWVLGVLTVIIIIAETVPGEFIGMLVLFSIGLPFLMVYLTDRSRRWALIPAGILLVIGLIPPLTLGFEGDSMGPVIMFLFALPFFAVYIWSPRSWWALIPAGFFASIGLAVLMTLGDRTFGVKESSLVGGVLFAGWALTFLALWLIRSTHPTAWAKYPALGLAVMAVIAFGFGTSGLELVWPVAIIAVGAFLLYAAFRPKHV